jgi:hypothetical protein
MVGTTKLLDPNYSKGGVNIFQMARYPKEIKDKYNIDYMLKQMTRWH